EKLVREKGLFSFYRDGHQECCGIRKVEPLKRALRTLDAWVTGQRRDQSPWTRAEVPVIQTDPTFSSSDRELIKFNPLATWTPQPPRLGRASPKQSSTTNLFRCVWNGSGMRCGLSPLTVARTSDG